jgi:hypothetical protein
MANTYIPIQTITVATATATMSFTSIPQTYANLKIVISARTTRSAVEDVIKIGLNGVYTNQTARLLYTTGSTVQTTTDTFIYSPCNGDTATASTFGYTEFYIPNYTSTTLAKTLSSNGTSENNATSNTSYQVAGLWNPGTQAAVTSIDLTSYYSANFKTNTTATLYGLTSS